MSISDCRAWTETEKDEERVCREKSNELGVWVCYSFFLYPYVLFILFLCNINKSLFILFIYGLKVLFSNPTPAT